MKIWINIPKNKRLRLYINRPSIHRAYYDNYQFIILGFGKSCYFYGVTIFGITIEIYFKIRIDERSLVTWRGTELKAFGIDRYEKY